jgi:hypothetical protein
MAEPLAFLDLTQLRRVPLALVLTLAVQTGAGLLWAGAAAERINVLEQRVDHASAIAERLARLEAEMEAARESLSRLGHALDRSPTPLGARP